MGNPMAGHLVKKGFDVTVYDLRPQVAHAFVAQHGGKAANSLVDVAHGADAVITMLPDDKVVRKVVLGEGSENCVAAGLAKGAIVIDMGTSNPSGTRSLAEALRPRGIEVVDAPVMGGVVFAKDATLDIMVGGQAALVERVKPVLAALSVLRPGGRLVINAIRKETRDQSELLELDYATLCDFMTWDELDDDRSSRDLHEALDALEREEFPRSADIYQSVLTHWAEIRSREIMN